MKKSTLPFRNLNSLRFLLLFLIASTTFSMKGQCWQSVGVGSAHSIAIATNGTLWAWGKNDSGQLGIGTFSTYNDVPIQVGTDTNWQSIVGVGGDTNYASKTDGTLWGWGTYIGDGTWDDKNVPTQIGLATDWQSISVGYLFTMGIKTNGTLWTWGNDGAGQLGNGSASHSNVPVQIGTDTNWQKIATGGSHALAIKTDGTLWVWGSNGWGQLGSGNYTNKYVPFKLGIATNWQNIQGGEAHTLATRLDGTAWSWGWGTSGQLGDGTNTTRTTPTAIGSSADWQSIDCGANSNYVIKTDGTLWAWGIGVSGELGNGAYNYVSTPTQSGIETNWKNVYAGSWSHTITKKTDNTFWIFGENFNGQLGLGPILNKNIPTKITCPSSLAITNFVTNSTIYLYPNPATDILHIQNTFTEVIDKIIIKEITGKIVLVKSSNCSEIDIKSLSQGLYFITVEAGKESKTTKFIKN